MMISSPLSGLMAALRKLAADHTLASHDRTIGAEQAIKNYLATAPARRKQMLDELEHEVAAEAGEFWDTVREYIGHCRRTG
jgi:hypothetical protein